jgi:hypothetical protein
LVNAIAVTPVFGAPDYPQNERCGTTSHDCGCEKVLAHDQNLEEERATPLRRFCEMLTLIWRVPSIVDKAGWSWGCVSRWLWILFISALIAFRIAWWVNIPDARNTFQPHRSGLISITVITGHSFKLKK